MRSIRILPFLFTVACWAQEISRVIPFSGIPTLLSPNSSQAVTVQLKDTEGNVLLSEPQNVIVDANGRIGFRLGDNRIGLNPDDFSSGSSRFVDVVDGSGAVRALVLTARNRKAALGTDV